MMKNKEYLTDFLSAGKYGVILSIAVSLLLLTGGFLFQGFSLPEAFQVWRSGMCILCNFLSQVSTGFLQNMTKNTLTHFLKFYGAE